jgi:hypothetical protein
MRVVERTILFSPFGVLFWDPATRTRVRAGLDVVRRHDGLSRVDRARPNRSGVYVLHGPPAGRSRVEVGDPEGRFLPVAFDAELSPPGPAQLGAALPVIPLFSASSRPVPPGLAALRAQLATATGAASWALLELFDRGRSIGRGVADGNGLATVLFPYPEPTALPLSPPGGASGRLSDQTWNLGLRACFAGLTADRPDLGDLLDQPPATLLADESGNPLTSVELTYGREVVVRTSPHSTLLLVPAGSPPQP